MSRPADIPVTAAFVPWLGWWGLASVLAVRALGPAPETPSGRPVRLDVVVPAHDEEAGIGELIATLRAQAGPHLGRILVVADHCSDRTASVASAAGAEVLVRDGGDPGKPPSLREGIAVLAAEPDRGEAVVLVDGDCTVAPGFLAAISSTLSAGAQVVQTATAVRDDQPGAVRSSLRRSYGLRNVVRAAGRERLGLPCLLFGTGIVLRWDAVQALSFADPRMGEGDRRPVGDDTIMSLDLVAAGLGPRFCEGALVLASAPADDDSLGPQRLRWETGQLRTWRSALGAVPALVGRGDLRSLVALVDWMAPPLAPSVAAFAATTGLTVLLVVTGVASPVVLVLPTAAAAALVTYLGLGVTKLEGWRAAVDLFAGAPRFLAWKSRLYLSARRGPAGPGSPPVVA